MTERLAVKLRIFTNLFFVFLEHIIELMDLMEASNVLNKKKGEVQIAYGMSVYDKDPDVAAVFERADQRMYEKKALMKKII